MFQNDVTNINVLLICSDLLNFIDHFTFKMAATEAATSVAFKTMQKATTKKMNQSTNMLDWDIDHFPPEVQYVYTLLM